MALDICLGDCERVIDDLALRQRTCPLRQSAEPPFSTPAPNTRLSAPKGAIRTCCEQVYRYACLQHVNAAIGAVCRITPTVLSEVASMKNLFLSGGTSVSGTPSPCCAAIKADRRIKRSALTYSFHLHAF